MFDWNGSTGRQELLPTTVNIFRATDLEAVLERQKDSLRLFLFFPLKSLIKLYHKNEQPRWGEGSCGGVHGFRNNGKEEFNLQRQPHSLLQFSALKVALDFPTVREGRKCWCTEKIKACSFYFFLDSQTKTKPDEKIWLAKRRQEQKSLCLESVLAHHSCRQVTLTLCRSGILQSHAAHMEFEKNDRGPDLRRFAHCTVVNKTGNCWDICSRSVTLSRLKSIYIYRPKHLQCHLAVHVLLTIDKVSQRPSINQVQSEALSVAVSGFSQ